MTKKFQNRLSHLRRRQMLLKQRVTKNDDHICRIRGCLLSGVGELLAKNNTVEGGGKGSPEGDVTITEAPAISTDEDHTDMSGAQTA